MAKYSGGMARSSRARSRSTVVMAFSQAVATLQLPMSAAPRTRPGWRRAMVSATHPPMECPAIRTDSMPRWSRSPRVSATRSSIE